MVFTLQVNASTPHEVNTFSDWFNGSFLGGVRGGAFCKKPLPALFRKNPIDMFVAGVYTWGYRRIVEEVVMRFKSDHSDVIQAFYAYFYFYASACGPEEEAT